MIAGLALYVPDGARKRLRPLAGERGQAFVEYVLLLTVVAIAVALPLVTAWTGVVSTITTALTKIGNTITNP
jgi:Flp pilus assembly pilin Flp